MDRNNEPYQYLIFISDNFKGNDKIIDLIATQLSAFTDKHTHLKYNYGDYGIVLHFQSEFSFYILRDHVHMILEKVATQYFLMEMPKRFYAFMPPELKLNLFDLDEKNDNKKNESKNNKRKGLKNKTNNDIDSFIYGFIPNFGFDMFSEENMNKIIGDFVFNNEEEDFEEFLTIDEILEKIAEKGLNSLTEKEKQILDEYSKN